ncbi:MAG TPA: hypothetical protein VL985_04040 [Stellaceae bacterium]|nr:hypothetical protein [Stellaceae bacterium]
MTPKIGHYLNRTVMVSVPALFADGICRPFTLLGVELHGLWLQSDELTRRLLPEDKRDLAEMPSAVFVPFAQIAGVLVTAEPAPDQPQPKSAAPGTRARAAAKDEGAAIPKR